MVVSAGRELPPCGQGQGVGDECAEERAAHGPGACASARIELLLSP